MSDTKPQPGLAALLGATSAGAFLEENWPAHPFVAHGLSGSVRGLTSLPFLHSLDALLNAWPDKIQAHLPDVRDEASSIDAGPADARKLFANGLPLLFNQVQKISPVLQEWLAAIHRDLGLPQMTVSRCMVYATPDGKGTAAHFDQNINFVLQLVGTKKWWLAKNEAVANPPQRHTLGLPIDPELVGCLSAPMRESEPENKEFFVLNPGSVLFVPQGYWHGTEASGEALSLNFTYSQPSYADLFLAALRSRLLLSPEWRALADGASSAHAERREIAIQKLDELLFELKYDLPNWKAEDVLGATEGLRATAVEADSAPAHRATGDAK